MDDALSKRIAELASADTERSAAAAEALAHLGADARSAAVALVRACGAADETTRAWAAAALEDLGPPLGGQINELIALAKDRNSDVAYWAVTLLGRAGADAAPAVATLSMLLRNSSAVSVRERAAWALGQIGPAAAAAVPALHEAAAASSPRLARLAKAALEAITQ